MTEYINGPINYNHQKKIHHTHFYFPLNYLNVYQCVIFLNYEWS